MYLGLRAVLAKSFARIHRSNLINFGILPVEFADEADYAKIQQKDELAIEGIHAALGSESGELTITNKSKYIAFKGIARLSNYERDVILAGGLLPFTRKIQA